MPQDATAAGASMNPRGSRRNTRQKTWKKIVYYRAYYMIFLPVFIFAILFKYLPMFGVRYAFYKFTPFKQEFIGFDNFENLFFGLKSPMFWRSFQNTVFLSFVNLLLATIISVVVALMLNDLASRRLRVGYRLDMTTTLFGASAWITLQSMQLLCLGFTGYLVLNGQMEAGAIVMFQTYFTQLLTQVNSLVNIYPEIMKGFESIRSVSEIFLCDDVEDSDGKKKLTDVRGDIRFENVTAQYQDAAEPSLREFSLHIREGEHIAVVGESGSGKSTFLNLIIGFIHPSAGSVLLDGHNLSEIHLTSFRKQIAFVPQNVILLHSTIRENITYGMRDVSEEDLREAVRLAYLEELIERLPDGLDTKLGQHGDTLSGGEKQRITIARAVIRKPHIVVLDEATSALDSVSEAHVQKALDSLTKGRTTIAVAHRLHTIKGADRVILLQRGKLVEQGRYEELMERKGLFHQFHTIQM